MTDRFDPALGDRIDPNLGDGRRMSATTGVIRFVYITYQVLNVTYVDCAELNLSDSFAQILIGYELMS